MAILNVLNKISDFLEMILKNISFIFIMSSLLFAVEQVLTRNIFDHTIAWAEEVIVYMMLYSVFLLSPIATKYSSHITLDIIPGTFIRVRAVLSWVVLFLEIGTVTFLFGVYFKHIVNLYKNESVLMSGLEMPLWITQLSLGVAFAVIIFMSIVNLYKKIIDSKTSILSLRTE